jgi:acyl-coenzyme A synthetase/AMP-(fatty) acid ligase
MVKVAGKRGSLADINQVLLAIEGVTDGVVFDPAELELESTGRLAALVVSQSLGPAELRAALVPLLDPVFIPRPLLLVEQLPRNAAGKLRREDLRALVARASESRRNE